MAIQVPLSEGNGYTRLGENGEGKGGGNGAGDGCCYRKHRPWQMKLLLVLGFALLTSWIVYSAIDTLNFPAKSNTRKFTYGKSDSDFYDAAFSNGTAIIGVAQNSTKTEEAGQQSQQAMNISSTNGNGPKGEDTKGGKKFLTECKLPRVDPWDPAIQPFLDPTYYMNWLKQCKRQYPELTRLVNGQVVMEPEAKSNGTHCQFKCLYPHTDFDFVDGQWKEISEEPDCDIVETRCQHEKIGNNEFYYNYLHAQIYRRLEYKQERKWSKPERVVAPKPGGNVDIERRPDFGPDNGQGKRRAPDVHIFIIDSVSHTQFLRTMPKTVTWLRERMEAIPFPHLNKIGLNSRPNGYGIFFGIQAYPVEESPMGEGYTPPRDLWTMGGIYLDHEPFVGFEYRERNYRTMMAEDWGKGVFNWPRNYGFERQPTEHYMRPFHLRTESPYDSDKILTKIIHDKSCREPHHHIMQYLMDFIDAYEEQSKFSISWMSEIGHYNVNGPYRMDDEVYQFLRDYEAKLNNSFLFIMGDHGLRFGGIRWTKPGEVEDNNPALFLVLPQHLRYNNKLVTNLRENARQLVTHFDIHATLVNIAREGANMTVHSPFDKLAPQLKGPTPFGQSLLYPLDKSVPRNCGTLKIPFEFCQCQFETRNVTETEPKLGVNLAETMVARMNADLAMKKADEKCAKLEVDQKKPVEIIEFESAEKIDVFKVTYETIPGNGKFWGYMKVQNRGLAAQKYTFISTRFPRLNEYADQAYCTDDYAIAPYCYCKALLNASSTTTTASPPPITTIAPSNP